MKKIIIVLIMVFMCGVLAFTIPKNASAETINLYDDDYSATDFEQMANGESINIYASILDNVYYYNDLFVTIYGVRYTYFKEDNDIKINNITYLYRLGKIGTTGSNLSVTFNRTLNTYISNIDEMRVYGEGNAVPFSFPLTLDFYMVVDHREGSNVMYRVTATATLDFSSSGYGTWEQQKTSFIYVSTPNLEVYDFTTPTLNYQPTLLLYTELYGKGLTPLKVDVSYPVYIDEDVDFLDYIKNTTTSFLETDIVGELSFGDILLFVVSIGLLIFILRFFAGG